MSFWNFIGEFAVINMICNLFSGKPKHRKQAYSPFRNRTSDAIYASHIGESQRETDNSRLKIEELRRIDSKNTYGIDDADADALQDRIDELEERLDRCDIMSDRYDRIQDEIDRLQEKLDDIEDWQDMYNDLTDDPVIPPYNDFCYADLDRDEDW